MYRDFQVVTEFFKLFFESLRLHSKSGGSKLLKPA